MDWQWNFNMMRTLSKLRLSQLILLLAISGALVTLANTYIASYRVQRDLLIAGSLQSQRIFASKLADLTARYFEMVQTQLAFSARIMAGKLQDPPLLAAESQRLLRQNQLFDEVMVLDAAGELLLARPLAQQRYPLWFNRPALKAAIRANSNYLSEPFNYHGHRVLLMAVPVSDRTEQPAGALVATIGLDDGLNARLGLAGFDDGSTMALVDSHGHWLFHPDKQQIGKTAPADVRNKQGLLHDNSVASHRDDGGALIGYAPVQGLGWAVVFQRSRQATLAALDQQMRHVVFSSALVAVLTLALIGFFSSLISRPLRLLADAARNMSDSGFRKALEAVPQWYVEAAVLRRALLHGADLMHERIGELNQASITDPLTGLYNRRGMDGILQQLEKHQTPFAVIALDADYFKQVNDRHGHDVGDAVLKALALQMESVSRSADLLCRSGGEEFLIILPHTQLPEATKVAERLRRMMENTPLEPVGVVTLSLGVAAWTPGREGADAVLKAADKALYQAKNRGRNQLVVSGV